jgi:alkylated DNA nucleotide flippase Atl1
VATPATFAERVVAVITALPPGAVATYGEVAVEAGDPVGASRAVGNVLQQVDGLPWWRVVTASGRLVPGLEARHEELLAAEGVAVVGGRVSMGRRRTSGSSGRRQHG